MRTLVIITGASRGFGRSIAQSLAVSSFAGQKTDVILTASNSVLLSETKMLVAKNFASIATFTLDLSINDLEIEYKKLFSMIPHPLDEYNNVFLINNAGTLGRMESIESLMMEDYASALNLNVVSVLTLTSMFMKLFPSTHLKIMNISSLAA